MSQLGQSAINEFASECGLTVADAEALLAKVERADREGTEPEGWVVEYAGPVVVEFARDLLEQGSVSGELEVDTSYSDVLSPIGVAEPAGRRGRFPAITPDRFDRAMDKAPRVTTLANRHWIGNREVTRTSSGWADAETGERVHGVE